MDRLMCLHVQSNGEPVEVHVNGVPLLRLPAGASSQCVTVHEYLLAGSNRLTLVVRPPHPSAPAATTQPRLAERDSAAQARLMLLRSGKSLHDGNARVLGEVSWTAAEGSSFEAPATVEQTLDLPVTFPRWRWLDAPVLQAGATERNLVLAWLQRVAFELSRGNPDLWLSTARLKLEELALAYQRTEAQVTAALRAQVQTLWQDQALATLLPPTAETLVLRPVAGGRLLECLNPMGQPVLSTQNDPAALPNPAWPLRLTLIEGKVYVLR